MKNKDNSVIRIQTELCDYCGSCLAVCPDDCLYLSEKDISIDLEACSRCLNCIKVCPLKIITRENTI
ncbi:MAG: 4Fe-4S binding protein [Deltaproteobacteria bacterium]|nr:4Fe-4S binding protein [Deltaproteobacteria bacterium]